VNRDNANIRGVSGNGKLKGLLDHHLGFTSAGPEEESGLESIKPQVDLGAPLRVLHTPDKPE